MAGMGGSEVGNVSEQRRGRVAMLGMWKSDSRNGGARWRLGMEADKGFCLREIGWVARAFYGKSRIFRYSIGL